MKKKFNPFGGSQQAPPPPKAITQLIDAFCDTYKPVIREEYAEEIFTVRRIREYFQAWPVPKMPDPLPPYMEELEKRGFAMQTSYEGSPALFCVRWQVRGEVCSAEEINEQDIRTGSIAMKELISRRISMRPDEPLSNNPEDEEEEEDDPDEDD